MKSVSNGLEATWGFSQIDWVANIWMNVSLNTGLPLMTSKLCNGNNTNHQCNTGNLKNTSKATSGARNGTIMMKWVSFEWCSYSCNTSSLSSTCPSLICNWDLGVLPYLTWILKISSLHLPPAVGGTAEEKGHQVKYQHKAQLRTILLLVICLYCSSNQKVSIIILSGKVNQRTWSYCHFCSLPLSSWQFTLSLIT